jgi:ribokinase
MRPVAVCGSLNMDVFGYVGRLPRPGETVLGGRLAYAPGGKGANQAVAAARAGAPVRFFGACGRDANGDQVLAALAEAGVGISDVVRTRDPTGVAMILVEDTGENMIVAIPGANGQIAAPPRVDAAVWLTQGEVPPTAVEGTLAAARAGGATAIVNPAPAGRLPASLVASFDVAVVNETELAALDGEHPPAVVLTLGRRGVRLLPAGTELAPFPATAVDSTGAGDALIGAMAAALAEGRRLAEAVRFGMAAAALSVEHSGAQPAMPHRAKIERRLGELI